MVWIQIRTDILSVLIMDQTVCKGYQQMTTVATSRLRDKQPSNCSDRFTSLYFAVPAEADSNDNGFGEFLSSPPASQTEQLGTGLTNDTNLSTSHSSMNPVTMTTTSQNTPLQQTHIPQPKEEKKG